LASVMIVEDEEQVRVLAEGIIQELGHETLTAGDLAEAIALLDDSKSIDLLFTDLRLNDEPHGGLTIAKHARTKYRKIAVIYTTGSGVNDGTRALFVERHWFLSKPYRPKDLEIVIGNALGGRAPAKVN
jgi:CheY-like chemotaxis protein